MIPTHITLGGYQPPASVHNQAAEILGQELGVRLGDAIEFEMDGNMVATRGIKAMDFSHALLEYCSTTGCYLGGIPTCTPWII